MTEKSGPESFAPPESRSPDKRSGVERVGVLRPQRNDAEAGNGPAAENLNAVVRRVAGDSIEEIDRVIRALENVRDMMRTEGERVSREIAGYASLSNAAAAAMRVIGDSIKQWKDASDKSGSSSAS